MPADAPPAAAPHAAAPLWPWVMAGAGCVLLPALLNGMPFVYYDTVAYVTWPQRLPGPGVADLPAPAAPPQTAVAGVAVAEAATEHYRGRAPTYRLVGWGTQALGLGLWLLVAAQALAVSATLALLWRTAAPQIGGAVWLAGLALLALLTPLGLFAGLVMPDILSGLLILAAGLMSLGWARLTPGARWFLGLLAGYAMMVHLSHAALGLALLIGLGVLALARWRLAGLAVARPGLGVLALGLGAALAAEVAVNAVHARLTDRPLLTRPHVTANLVDRGPGTAFLRRACPEAGFALCAHVERLPMHWIDFLFDQNPATGLFAAVPSDERRALSAEHGRFVLAVLADDPVAVVRFALAALGEQLVRFRAGDATIAPHSLDEVARRLPPALGRPLPEAPIMHHHAAVMRALDATTLALVVLSLGLLLAAGLRRRLPPPAAGPEQVPQRAPEPAALARAMVPVILAGLLANAAICGILAAPYDRFQARLIWLLPLAALLVLSLSHAPALRRKAVR